MKAKRPRGHLPALLSAIALICASAAPARAAEPPLLRQFCETGTAGGRCTIPRGIAVDPASGDVYLADSGATNLRIEKFTAWGQFLRAWGWDVVASGPDNGGGEFETCVPSNGDLCKGGLEGSGAGQFGGLGPQGVTVDSAGGVYVVDLSNRRVQKFDSDGHFLWMVGGGVNKTKVEAAAPEAERNLCPIAPTDVCQAATEGSGNGQFAFSQAMVGSFLAASPDGETIYVGDTNRIQELDATGHYTGQIALPEPGTVGSLAVDPNNGDLYFSYASNIVVYPNPGAGEAEQPDVHRLDPATGNEIGQPLEVAIPKAIAADSEGDVYAFEAQHHNNNPEPQFDAEILKFNAAGELVESFGRSAFDESTGIAASSACAIEGADLFVGNANLGNSFVRIYGPPPTDTEKCPPPKVAPTISSQHAVSVSTDSAQVEATLNPHFWPETTYYVEYGTSECHLSPESCEGRVSFPGAKLGAGAIDAEKATPGVFIGALQPDTTYHYRFVAQSGGGGPAFGTDPDGEGPAEASFEAGLEASFHTYPTPYPARVDCSNQALRGGLSAPLPDCRAYEMVSPVHKNGGDIATGEGSFAQTSPDGGRIAFSSFRAFGEPLSAPLSSQYLAQRDPAAGWSSHSISPPRSPLGFYAIGVVEAPIGAYGEDLCDGWVIQDSELTLAPGAPQGVPNLYRRTDRDCGAEGYELLSTVEPPGFAEQTGFSTYYPVVQGFSADGSRSVFRADAKLTPEACSSKEIFQVYEAAAGQLHLASVLPDGKAACVHSSAGTFAGKVLGFREASVEHAVSADGERVFWSASATGKNESPAGAGGGGQDQPGPLYLRLNATQQQSEFAGGIASASGTGNLTAGSTTVGSLVAAAGKGTIAAGSPTVASLLTTTGRFVAGQPISGPGIPGGTTILEATPTGLTLSANATGSGAGVPLTSKGPMPFAVGQRITGPGIPFGTTIVAAAAGSLTLSAAATKTQASAPLAATGKCDEAEKACTIPISEAADTLFWTAAGDGSRAIYTAEGKLYEYDVEAEEAHLIAEGAKGVAGASGDASRVYFVSTKALTGSQQNSAGGEAQEGKPNLYLYERGAGLSFVATLAAVDAQNSTTFPPPSPISVLPNQRTARVSGDGLHLAFTSTASLTGYDNADAASGEPDAEAFLYDAKPGGGAGTLVCVSCNPGGARPTGRRVFVGENGKLHPWAVARIPGWESQLHPSRALSEDGQRLFFESFEALVPRDTNGRQDVYEWERASTRKECEEAGAELYVAASGGCLSLISSGKSGADAEFFDASASGSDVFFASAASLLPQDPGLVDVYDAREAGGFPQPPPAPGACEGEACQGTPSPPNDPTPGSSSFEGAGNAKEAPAKGKRRRHKHRRHKRHRARPNQRGARR